MCGIAGFIGEPGPADALGSALGAMLDRIVHRGPDDAGAWLDPALGLGLGMRRLAIVDLAGGRQPVWNEDGFIGVVFNGEIYNHAELRAELITKGHVFKTRSDTEVLVHLHEEYGVDMLGRLRGMYALALVDRRAGRLLLARDPFGQKPLHLFAPGPGRLAFASEPKSFRALPAWTGETNPDAYLDYLCWLSLPAPATHWRHVEKLAPGEWRVLDLTTAETVQRGRVDGLRFSARPDLRDPEAAAAALEDALEDSVRRHLEADVPVGLLLSGGSDSLALGLAVSRVTDARLHTFTVGFADADNEFAAASRTAGLLASEHHEIGLSPDCLTTDIDAVNRHLDEPVGDPAAVAVLAVCRRACEHVKVLLGGEGADELLAGYAGRYTGLAEQLGSHRRLRRLPSWLLSAAGLVAPRRLGHVRARAARSPLEELLVLRAEGLGPNHPWLREHAPSVIGCLLNRVRFRAEHLEPVRTHGDLDLAQALDLRWQLPESLLVKADRMSMAASVELRCPFLDPAVAAVAARLAVGARIDATGRTGKLALRGYLRRHLPADAARPKQGFPLPLGRWLRGPLADDLRGRLTDPASAFADLVGGAAARAWCEDFLAGRSSPHLAYALWSHERWRASSGS